MKKSLVLVENIIIFLVIVAVPILGFLLMFGPTIIACAWTSQVFGCWQY